MVPIIWFHPRHPPWFLEGCFPNWGEGITYEKPCNMKKTYTPMNIKWRNPLVIISLYIRKPWFPIINGGVQSHGG